MGLYNETDISVTPSGDIGVGPDGDLQMVSASGVLKQDVTFRLRTNYGEFEPHPDFGADLEELIGEPNTRDVAKQGEAKITHSLTFDGMVRSTDLYVRAVPISSESIVYYVFINDGLEKLNVTPDVVFNMVAGITNIPGA